MGKAQYEDFIDGLRCCTHLQILILADNGIIEVENLECCPQLWKVDLSNNKIKGLDGLRQFIALGTLDLSGNLLTWKELQKIRHIQILDLRLYGNPALQNDAHYRVHVVDCLSRAWMVDGHFVTSKERHSVAQFFLDSALSGHPITVHLMKQFPLNEQLNSGTIYKYATFHWRVLLGSSYSQRL
ncbi:uncharacterized protein LOC144692747 isoform X2 [Cetorhinus maximus]